MFPGQGSHRPGMGRPWAGRPGWDLVGRAAEITGRDVAALLLDADEPTLRRTENTQLATFVLELVILAELTGLGTDTGTGPVTPVACAGHSLGEFTALVAAGVLSIDDGIRLVHARGTAMREAAAAEPGAMSAVLGLDQDEVEDVAAGLRADGARVWAANLNAPGNVVVSGTPDGVARCGEEAVRRGALRVVGLPVGGAFHTPLMAPALGPLEAVLETAVFADGHAPVVANVDAEPHGGGPDWRGRLLRQLTGPVQWSRTVPVLTERLGCDLLLEVGPGRTLTGLAKRLAPRAVRADIGEPDRIADVVLRADLVAGRAPAR
ncbi:[acyl-carrier-protein] S-malonyltransferase [Thermomonospora echinospora]|uniref:Malonyl CoA-acyl carrier protein transacylase n=2 Tax=Thermomonospora echinospora TaxID=1992 RepID=A0A1H5VEV7_9ACTN|nr:[acyl-carrier-protein] S-malonyltransferase [Thermomonospora echinospora]